MYNYYRSKYACDVHMYMYLPSSLQLFVDKDTLVSALNSAHDVHNLAVDNKEDSIAQRSKRDLNSLLEELQEQELKRNRRKVIEIEQFIEQQRYDIESSELAASQ